MVNPGQDRTAYCMPYSGELVNYSPQGTESFRNQPLIVSQRYGFSGSIDDLYVILRRDIQYTLGDVAEGRC